jgi:hypothetical protein
MNGEVRMLFKKLFQVLVLGGVVVAGESGCAANAETKPKKEAADAGTPPPDAGQKPAEGSGVPGW